jgi:hypothetical protein
MNKELKLTWKYFWEQKIEEVKDFLEDYGLFFFFIMTVLGISSQGFWLNEKLKFIAIIGLCIISLEVVVGIIALIKNITEWIKDNWKKAKERARKEVKRNDK